MEWLDTGLFSSAMRMSAPLALAALGGLYSERAGVVNIAIEGCMLFGAFAAALAAYYSGDHWLGLAAGTAAGGLASALHALVTVGFRGDQIVSGIAVNILALGVPSVICNALFGTPTSTPSVTNTLPVITVPVLSDIPYAGEIFFQHTFPVYFAIFAAAVSPYILWRTVFGLRLRAAGENPAAAEALGVKIRRYRWYGVIIGGLLAGIGGTFLSLGHGSAYIKNMTVGRGYIALAAMIFGKWKPIPTLAACFLFGTAEAMQIRLQGLDFLPVQFIQMIPYVLTILVLIGFIGRAVPPQAAGKPY